MNLLFGRSQNFGRVFSLVPLRIGSGAIFHLHAELELDEGEKTLIDKYRFANTALIVSDPIEDIKNAFRPAMLLGIVSFVVFWFFTGFFAAMPLAFAIVLVMTIVYFRALREQILVSDLMNGGRTFYCDSIIALIQKEAYLQTICEYLRQVLESAKTWDDRERLTINPLERQEARQAVLQGIRVR